MMTSGLLECFWIKKTPSEKVNLPNIKGYLAFIYLIKNQSIGIAEGAVHDLFWILDHVID